MPTGYKACILAAVVTMFLLGITGCSSFNNPESRINSPASAIVGGLPQKFSENELDTAVFPKDKVIDINILIDQVSFQDMLDNAADEQYKEASVDYNGLLYEHVAIRTKGNSSLRSVVNQPDSDRYSFKLSFDEYVNQTIAGISKINLNNNYSDATSMREFLTYQLAEQLGLPVPKYSFVQIYINNEPWGLYLAVEQIGTAYLERNFGSTQGALYKSIGGDGSELGSFDSFDDYTGLEVKSKTTSHQSLLNMLAALNSRENYSDSLNISHALGYIALNTATANFDSYLGNFKHNYYLYEHKGSFSILPWDFNMSFGGFGKADSLLIDEPTTGKVSDRPLVDILLNNDLYKEQYHTILANAINGLLSPDKFDARVDELSELINHYVETDPTAFYTYEQYRQGLQELKTFNRSQTALIAQQLDGILPASAEGLGSGGGMGGMGGFANMGGGAGMEDSAGRGNRVGMGNTGGKGNTDGMRTMNSKDAMAGIDDADGKEGIEDNAEEQSNVEMPFPGKGLDAFGNLPSGLNFEMIPMNNRGGAGRGDFPGMPGDTAKQRNAENEFIVFSISIVLLLGVLLIIRYRSR